MTFLKLLHSELLKRPTSKNIGSTVHLCITFVIKSLMNSNIRNCINLSDNSFRFLILEQTNELICSSYLQNCFDSTFRWKRFVSSIIPNGGRRSLAAQCRQLLLKEREREKEKKRNVQFRDSTSYVIEQVVVDRHNCILLSTKPPDVFLNISMRYKLSRSLYVYNLNQF